MTEFKTKERVEGDVLHLAMEGQIDEDTVFPPVDASKFKVVAIDLKAILAINSVGIREWLDWIKPIAQSCQILLANCPKAMVFQFNMVEGFLPPKAKVESFYVPYFCEKCDREENVLFQTGREVLVNGGKVQINVDTRKLTGCTEVTCEMEMDVTEAKYFQFLKRS